ncbi:MAG: trypsin-like serine peptidase, partial [Rhizobiaceae bacterium]
VLTAWHVISAKGEKEPPVDRRIEVLDSQGKTHPARVDYASPCHADEWSNDVPTGSNGNNCHDTLVLRIAEPIGQLLGHLDLPSEPLSWADNSTFALVHFPKGEDRGIGLGRLGKNDGNSVRVTHELTTKGGSSGGPCFDLQGRFLGLHQGRLGKQKRLVPYNRFAGEPDFRRSLDHDCDPAYLWSLDNSLDGHLIIGRNALFSAADAMRGNRHDNVRGLWVQRTSLESDAGLSFTYEILDRYLDPKKHRLIRISPGLSTDDFIEQAATATGSPEALDQVKSRDESDASRIRALSVWLNETANTEQRKLWLFIDNPSSGLIGQTQKQLGQFVVETLRHPLLRTVLTGCETYRLDVDIFSTLDMADRSFSPGYFREFIGRFKRRDVWETLSLIGQDIGMRWGGERREEAAYRVLHPFKAVVGSHYSMKDMGGVADEIRSEVKLRQLFETVVPGR